MKILLSNDDGITAPGLAALVRCLNGAGHEVTVCAPDGQRSATSQSLTIGRPLVVKPARIEGAVRAYAIGGTPADCVKLGLSVLCPEAEAVFSGVNHGYNAGTDVLYSGTIGAAMEGALSGRPALAISLASAREDTYDLAAQTALRAFEHIMRHPMPPYCVMNVNYPACDCAKGLVSAPIELLHYDETYVREENEAGETVYRLEGAIHTGCRQSPDYELLKQGYATMTVLHYDMTHREATAAITSLE